VHRTTCVSLVPEVLHVQKETAKARQSSHSLSQEILAGFRDTLVAAAIIRPQSLSAPGFQPPSRKREKPGDSHHDQSRGYEPKGPHDVPDYIDADHDKMTAKLIRIPALSDVPFPIHMEPSLVVEYYSRLTCRWRRPSTRLFP
jgi:ribosomal protein S4